MKEIPIPFLQTSDLIRLEPHSAKDFPAFHIGQILKGKVLEVRDDRRAVIRMEGRNLSVESRMPLARGTEGLFKVKSVYPQIILQFLQPEEANLLETDRWLKAFLMTDSSKENLSERLSLLWKAGRDGMAPAVRETMDRLADLWSSFSPSRSLTVHPGQIEKMIAQSGLFFEHTIGRLIKSGNPSRFEEVAGRDVKGLLVKLRAQIETSFPSIQNSEAGSSLREELLDSVNHLLRSIESLQLFHSHPSHGGAEKIFLLLPFWVEDRLQLVDLQLSLPQTGSNAPDQDGMSMLFLLHLPEWGRMSIEVRMTGKRLYGRFLLSSEEVTIFFREAIPELQRRLLQLGFQPEMRASTQTPEKMVETFLNEMKGSDRSLLNLIV